MLHTIGCARSRELVEGDVKPVGWCCYVLGFDRVIKKCSPVVVVDVVDISLAQPYE